MIPRHRPPSGTLSLLTTAAKSAFRRSNVPELELAWQRSLDVQHAVWIPSARWAIARTIQSHTTTAAEVVCPVFNCGAVHHAVSESGRNVDYRDCAADSFLMNCSGAASGSQAIVLSEIFGHRFSPSELSQPLIHEAAVRIFDLAMGIPTTNDMQRMQSGDVTVLSFGLGKSLYAGWGGMALTNCNDTADMLRRRRDDELQSRGAVQRTRWNASVVLRTVAHEPWIYRRVRAKTDRPNESAANPQNSFSAASHEWNRPPTAFHVAHSLRNLRMAGEWAEQRLRLLDEYRIRLQRISPMVQLPLNDAAAFSHFSIRVPGSIRESLRKRLWDNGVDVASLFPFPAGWCAAEQFPLAARAATEVLNLPLSNQLQQRDVVRVCDALKRAVDELSALPSTQKAAA
ncbi:DegT/DnrJ/EryC1/StrS family aminotransferase [Fuerstiella marisgermanici]|uniref:UDP-4-keto-6-deoxy-N-acetylglucosamine 4-aminotransferase n=1 Tax=Fuerstiella marisgermanici TaxID=1891926 RepID=A0A1P8WLA6_9PLAN|nr:DegT/DnrJ/EryC1/StrS family aminotransferase [Fuerstiella marisgermanici]APZ94823.1 UDP-4-keto-6-deoxy-N-acetylglucosamine 4-aminotransferase [Fuerstiella marisgermanici]